MGYRDYDPLRALSEVTHRDLFGGVNPPLVDSITFNQDPVFLEQCFAGKLGPEDDYYVYARFAHPNTEYLGCQISAIEDAAWTGVYASGQAAMSTVVNALSSPGDTIFASNRLYGGTMGLLGSLPDLRNIGVTFVDATDPEAVRRAFEECQKKRPSVFVIEPVSNPSVVAVDVGKLAAIAHEFGALVVADNTFTPLSVLPLRLGADIVVHSLTKYVSGASDGIAGSVSLSRGLPAEIKMRIRKHAGLHGPVLHHSYAQSLSKRMASLAVRVKEAGKNARFIARALVRNGVTAHYPLLPGYAYAENFLRIAHDQKFGGGGVVAADLGNVERAVEFVRQMKKCGAGYSAVSLGSSHTYACAPLTSVSSNAGRGSPPELTTSLVRIAVGYDTPGDALWEKMERAL